MTETRFRQAFLLLLVASITAAFVAMVRDFLLTIVLASIFAGPELPAVPVAARAGSWAGSGGGIATLVLLLALVIAPLLAVLGAAATEALRITETIRPRLQEFVSTPGEFTNRLRGLPGYGYIEPYREQILTKAGELVGSASAFLFGALSAATRATAVFIFQVVVLLYTMFFFLIDGPGLLRTRACVPAVHGIRQATDDHDVRVGHPRDAEGHDPDRRGAGPARRSGVLGRRVSTVRSSGEPS